MSLPRPWLRRLSLHPWRLLLQRLLLRRPWLRRLSLHPWRLSMQRLLLPRPWLRRLSLHPWRLLLQRLSLQRPWLLCLRPHCLLLQCLWLQRPQWHLRRRLRRLCHMLLCRPPPSQPLILPLPPRPPLPRLPTPHLRPRLKPRSPWVGGWTWRWSLGELATTTTVWFESSQIWHKLASICFTRMCTQLTPSLERALAEHFCALVSTKN